MDLESSNVNPQVLLRAARGNGQQTALLSPQQPEFAMRHISSERYSMNTYRTLMLCTVLRALSKILVCSRKISNMSFIFIYINHRKFRVATQDFAWERHIRCLSRVVAHPVCYSSTVYNMHTGLRQQMLARYVSTRPESKAGRDICVPQPCSP